MIQGCNLCLLLISINLPLVLCFQYGLIPIPSLNLQYANRHAKICLKGHNYPKEIGVDNNSDNNYQSSRKIIDFENSPVRTNRRDMLHRACSNIHKGMVASVLTPCYVSNDDCCYAMTPQEAAVSYDTYSLHYDDIDGGPLARSFGIDEARRNLLQSAKGRVIEIGAGTGLNMDKYQFSTSSDSSNGVHSLTLVDISEGMLNKATEKFLHSTTIPKHVEISFVKADATKDLVSLFGRNQFDTVVDTFSLCVMGESGARNCLKQLRDIVKTEADGGVILLIENTKSPNQIIGSYQDVTAGLVASFGGKGCLYNQDVRSLIDEVQGLRIIKDEILAAGFFTSFICAKE